ncbi:MAG: phosphoribosylformylglycinamidine synthase, partial [Saprospiraceae bacterium]|nr:phosphoribosylformylglycinamidine synthase [Saprospiraceae bacterium]
AEIEAIRDIAAYNKKEGLALNTEEIEYLEALSQKLGRPLTDSEVFGFSQVNSEHCRHKIFNGTFVIDGQEQPDSLFKLIKKTSQQNPNEIVSAYQDNVAFMKGPAVSQFAPVCADKPDYYVKTDFKSVISLKAETHNFPTTVEPFNGAATGSGGEIRDRMAGGQGSIPLAGTAVYMTAYPRLSNDRPWENGMNARPWLYQTPLDILIKASNGASDFGNKFGQPLIAGSVLTFEHDEGQRKLGYDKVIMLAGGIGYGKLAQAQKERPEKGDKIVVLGGDNYRIGMGGAAVSSADTGEFSSGIELNAVQRSNPEMQKRVANTVRAMVESDRNPIVSIHDHGAGGHLNCLSELVEATGGMIELDRLPIGDPTLSAKEIIGNESQERMGLVMHPQDVAELERVAHRERAPIYIVGEVTGDQHFSFVSASKHIKPIDLDLHDMFGSSPKTIMDDVSIDRAYPEIKYQQESIRTYLESVLLLESVGCKDWLTNKVDRCVGGKVAKQQCVGPLQLPLNNVAVMAIDFEGIYGIATSIGHSPLSGLIDAAAGARNAIGEALTNLVWAPLEKGLKSVSLSANWMWPCNNPGEDARLYEAVKSVSDFCIELGINVPTGKDSLSMKQKYKDQEVIAPGTVIISAGAQCSDIGKIVEPVLQKNQGPIYYIPFTNSAFKLGGSSFAQTQKEIGRECPDIPSATYFATVFNTIQDLIKKEHIIAGHDISSGGLITTLLELCFADNDLGAEIDLTDLKEKDTVKALFSENCGIIIQAKDHTIEEFFKEKSLRFHYLGNAINEGILTITNQGHRHQFRISEMRDIWYQTSRLLDQKQSGVQLANARYENYKKQPLVFKFPTDFKGQIPGRNIHVSKPKAAIIRDQGSNSERELAHALYLAGF